MSVTSANRLELLQIADAVAREKLIDPALVVEAMEESLAKAARSRYGAEYDIRAKIDRQNGALEMTRVRTVVEEVENTFTEMTVEDAGAYLTDPKVGDEITYTIVFNNIGIGAVENCTGDDTLLGPLGAFDDGVPRDFLYTVLPGDPNPLPNTATITCDDGTSTTISKPLSASLPPKTNAASTANSAVAIHPTSAKSTP